MQWILLEKTEIHPKGKEGRNGELSWSMGGKGAGWCYTRSMEASSMKCSLDSKLPKQDSFCRQPKINSWNQVTYRVTDQFKVTNQVPFLLSVISGSPKGQKKQPEKRVLEGGRECGKGRQAIAATPEDKGPRLIGSVGSFKSLLLVGKATTWAHCLNRS